MGTYKERAKRFEEHIHNCFQAFQSDDWSCIFEEEGERYRNLLFVLTQAIGGEYRKIDDEILTRKIQSIKEYAEEYIMKSRSGDDSVTSSEYSIT